MTMYHRVFSNFRVEIYESYSNIVMYKSKGKKY